MKKLLLLFSLLPAMLAAGEFTLHAAFDSGDPGTKLMHNAFRLKVPALRPDAYMVVRAYPADKKSHLVKFSKFVSNDGFSFTASDAREIIWLTEGYGKISVKKDTRCAFRIFVPKNCGGRFVFYTRVNKKRRAIGLQITPDTWQNIDIKLCSSGLLKAGEVFSSLSLLNNSSGKRNWKIDKFAIWSGEAPVPAAPGNGKITTVNDDNKIVWTSPKADFPVSHYKIYRGSVAGFEISDKSLIGETGNCSFIDSKPMRTNDYYKIVAVNIAGKTSAPTAAIQAENK